MQLSKSTFYAIIFLLCLVSEVKTQDSIFQEFQYRTVGPMRGGRVTTVAGTAWHPGTFYMGATGGGVWKTTDYGISWNNISDGYFTSPSIGDIAVATQDPNIIYVGTGSDGIRSNVIIGDGVYKSIDAGKTWKHLGLEKVGQIGAVIIHPQNHNIVYVAAQGNPFAATSDRGIYKTEDGGRTWSNILYVSEQTGFSDIEMLPGNPEILFAAAWKNERKPWTIISGGTPEEGGVYKSVNGGKTWEKIVKGLPSKLIGKIDIALCPSDSRIVYALVEAPKKEGGLYRSEDQGETFVHLSDYRGIRTRPFYYTNLEVNPRDCEMLYVMATGYYRSTDGCKSWSYVRAPHGDAHAMWINPDNPELFIQANDGGANVTLNGGQSWSTQYNQPTAELYQVEVDDQYPYWLYAGQQDNYTTIAVPSMAPYAVQNPEIGLIINTGGCETGPAVPKPGDPDIVYSNCKGRFSVFNKKTGLEQSYDVGARYMYGHNPAELKYRFQRVSPIHISPHDRNVIYHTSQYVHKTTDEGKTWETISPDLTAFESDKQVISGSPITRDITGEEFYSTIYAIRESPLQPGLIWVGANDGPIHVTRDGGENWDDVTPSHLPKGGRIDAVEPSAHQDGKAYIAVLRYLLGDFTPYIYKTTNYGKSWTLLSGKGSGIPQSTPVRVVREDPVREGLLFAGTDAGIYLSYDDGKSWQKFQQNLPITPITDIKIHRNDIVLSTMGRGFWILDEIQVLRDAAFNPKQENVHLFNPGKAIRYRYPNTGGSLWPRPDVKLDYFLPANHKGPIQLHIYNDEDQLVQSYSSAELPDGRDTLTRNMATNQVENIVNHTLKDKPGLHRFSWDMNHRGPWREGGRKYSGGPMVAPGDYTIELITSSDTMWQSLILLSDPRVLEMGVTEEDIYAQEVFNLEVVDLISEANQLVTNLKKQKKKLSAKKEMTKEDKALLKKVKEALAQMETEEGTYMKPVYISQLGYLYGITNGPDARPGKDAITRLEELRSELQSIKSMVE